MYCWSLPRLSFHPVLPVTVNTLVSIFKFSPLDLKVCVTCFRRTEAKQSKKKYKQGKFYFLMLDTRSSLSYPYSCFFARLFVLFCFALKDNQIKEEAPLELQKFRMELTPEYLSPARGACTHGYSEKSFQEPSF